MDEINFREVFNETCYRPAVETMLTHTSSVISNHPTASKAFLDSLEAFIGCVLAHQEKGDIPLVRWISLSFLRTSMQLERPVFMVEAYEQIPFVVKPVMGCEIDASWMFPCWKEFQENMQEGIRQQLLGRYVRKPELKSYESQAVTVMLSFFILFMKYAIRDLESRPVWMKMEETKNFTISYGEYLDWQLPVSRIRESIDLFQCEEKEELTYRRFQNLYYEEKQFDARIMDDCVFRGCTFHKVHFQGTRLRNVRFVDCVFEDCQFENVELMGSSVLSSRLKNVVFKKCKVLTGFYREEQNSIFYISLAFKWSLLEDVKWKETEMADSMYVDCQLFQVTKE